MNTHQHAATRAHTFSFTDPAGTRVVVASQGEAHFYDVGPGGSVTAAGFLLDAMARLHDRDFSSDRPGRVFDRAAPAGRRSAVAHHSTNGERSPHRHEALVFARRIAAALEHERCLNHFSRLVIIAAPAFLGLLRAAMRPQLRGMIVAQLRKDLAHRPAHVLAAHIGKALAQRDW